MRKRTFLSAGVAATLLATGGIIGGAGTAVAAGDPTYYFDPVDARVLMPGEGYTWLSPSGSGGQHTGEPDGTFVYAISKKPLTDAGWSGGGAPAGLKVDPTGDCAPKAGKAGVYLCDLRSSGFPAPEVEATSTAANNTTAYYSLVYVPRGSSVDAGIKEAQTAATKPIGTRRAHSTITVKTRAHVAKNTMAFTVPALPAGGTVKHTVKLHAVDAGKLVLGLSPAPGQRRWDEGELKVQVTGVDAGGAAGAACDHSLGEIGRGDDIRCEIGKPGDYTVSYTLKAAATAPAWRLRTTGVYEVYDFGTGNPEKAADFGVAGTIPVTARYQLTGRTPSGDLYFNQGSGRSPQIFKYSDLVGGTTDWNSYSALTRLGPLTVQSTGPGAVARDRGGVLWFLAPSGDGGLFQARRKVGGGWNVFNALAGAGDLTGDGKADLVARDKAGVLWLYRGTGVKTAPFAAKTRIGGGWNVMNALAGGTDLSGDGRPDLIARDKAGVLWLYPGNGKGAFGAPHRVGGGWGVYTSLVSPGDLNSDGRADLVARDSAGVLWYYQGTGTASRPFPARVRVGGGWNMYNLLF
ncbi:FG-GAP repeat domain-containing protein [Streptomyces sp. NPDC127049]|uniref:FG-GAP repeat domain-containing protein n=1 Tax=Streptomyces sp. NPDC127049 TaxID=3347118 RepID=UPI0036485D43